MVPRGRQQDGAQTPQGKALSVIYSQLPSQLLQSSPVHSLTIIFCHHLPKVIIKSKFKGVILTELKL